MVKGIAFYALYKSRVIILQKTLSKQEISPKQKCEPDINLQNLPNQLKL